MLVRHGRTEWNRTKRYQGHTDVALDDVGRDQARAVARDLESVAFDAAVSSDLRRASETARIVLGPRDVGIVADSRWRELAFGVWEGLTWSEIVERYPEVGEASLRDRFVTPEGGESFEALCLRVRAALDDLRDRYPGRTVLVATHAGPLHAVLEVALGEAARREAAISFVPGSTMRLRLTGASDIEVVERNRVPRDPENKF